MRSLHNTTKITRQTCSHLLSRTHWQEQSTKWKNLSMTSKKMVQIHFWKSTITDGFTGLFQNKYLSFIIIILHWSLHFPLLMMTFCKIAFVTSRPSHLKISNLKNYAKHKETVTAVSCQHGWTCFYIALFRNILFLLWNPFLLHT